MGKTLILNKLYEYKNFKSRNEFARFLGITSQTMANWFNRDTYDLETLILKFPEVRPLWLITGEGDMLGGSAVNNLNTPDVQNEYQLGAKSGHILPVRMGVAGPSIHDIETGEDLQVVTANDMLPDFEFAYKIKTEMCFPVYLPGDWLLINKCPAENLESGKPYLVDTVDFGVMIKRVEIIGDKFILSLPVPKPGYPVLTLSKPEIYGFYNIACRVVAKIDQCITVAPSGREFDEFVKYANESLAQSRMALEIQNRTIDMLANVVNEFIKYKKSEK